jgi:hypothetical protein
VRLERWGGLHEKKGADVPYNVIRASVHLERETSPSALWLAWLAPEPMPGGLTVTIETIWRAYGCVWPVEPAIQFRKETLGWTPPRFQSKEVGDRWSELGANDLLNLADAIFTVAPSIEGNGVLNQRPSKIRFGSYVGQLQSQIALDYAGPGAR